MADSDRLLAGLRRELTDLPASGIVEVMTHGRGKGGLIPLWAGEGDMPTPAFICEAATRALAAGETFYTWQRGIPELREALARYHGRVYGGAFSPERFFVVGSGMQAIQIAFAVTLGPGDEVIIPTPAWPNAAGAARVAGGRPVSVPMDFGQSGFRLDLDRLAAAVTPRTRALFINTPSNPTGWTAGRAELAAILDLARRHGLWIVADEIYARFVYADRGPDAADRGPDAADHGAADSGSRAPSFRDVMASDDRVLFVQTFSKNWAMTGWRIGWIEAHPALGPVLENLIQYSTSGVPAFLQRAGIAALDRGEGFLAHQIARARKGRDIVCTALSATGRCRLAAPDGAFYLFFAVDGLSDSRTLALRLVDEALVGLAPGWTFGPGGEGWLRLCFLRAADQLDTAAARLRAWLTAGERASA